MRNTIKYFDVMTKIGTELSLFKNLSVNPGLSFVIYCTVHSKVHCRRQISSGQGLRETNLYENFTQICIYLF